MINFDDYEVFDDITNGPNRKTLMNCIHAEKITVNKATGMDLPGMHGGKLALVLDDNCKVTNSDLQQVDIPKGKVIDFTDEKNRGLSAEGEFELLLMEKHDVFNPCWFYCVFHVCFMDNINRNLF